MKIMMVMTLMAVITLMTLNIVMTVMMVITAMTVITVIIAIPMMTVMTMTSHLQSSQSWRKCAKLGFTVPTVSSLAQITHHCHPYPNHHVPTPSLSRHYPVTIPPLPSLS